jgi:hypothetical protein
MYFSELLKRDKIEEVTAENFSRDLGEIEPIHWACCLCDGQERQSALGVPR